MLVLDHIDYNLPKYFPQGAGKFLAYHRQLITL